MKGSRSSSGRRSMCGPRQTVREELGGLGRDDVPGLQPAARLGEAGAAQALLGLLGRGVVPGFAEALEVRRVGLARGDLGAARLQPRDVAGAAVLGGEAPARARAPRAGLAKSASWSRTQWKTALEKTTSTGSASSSSVRSATSASSWGRSTERTSSTIEARAVDGDHPALGQALDQHRGDPAAAAAGVEHRLVAAQLEPVEDRRAPTPRAGPRRAGSWPRPSRGCASPLISSAVVTGPAVAAPPPSSKASIAPAFSSVIADVVEAVQQPVLDVGLDLELEDARRPQVTVSSSTSIRASPASAIARQCSSSRIAGSSPIFVQLT